MANEAIQAQNRFNKAMGLRDKPHIRPGAGRWGGIQPSTIGGLLLNQERKKNAQRAPLYESESDFVIPADISGEIVDGPPEERRARSAAGLAAFAEEFGRKIIDLSNTAIPPDPNNPLASREISVFDQMMQEDAQFQSNLNGQPQQGGRMGGARHQFELTFREMISDPPQFDDQKNINVYTFNKEKFDALMKDPRALALVAEMAAEQAREIFGCFGRTARLSPPGTRGNANDLVQDIDLFAQGPIRAAWHDLGNFLESNVSVGGRRLRQRQRTRIARALTVIGVGAGAGSTFGPVGAAVGAGVGVLVDTFAALNGRGVQIRFDKSKTALMDAKLINTRARELYGIAPQDFTYVRGRLEPTPEARAYGTRSTDITGAMGKAMERIGLYLAWQSDNGIPQDVLEFPWQFLDRRRQGENRGAGGVFPFGPFRERGRTLPRTSRAEMKDIFGKNVSRRYYALREQMANPTYRNLVDAYAHSVSSELEDRWDAMFEKNRPPSDPYLTKAIDDRLKAWKGEDGVLPAPEVYQKQLAEKDGEVLEKDINVIKDYKEYFMEQQEGTAREEINEIRRRINEILPTIIDTNTGRTYTTPQEALTVLNEVLRSAKVSPGGIQILEQGARSQTVGSIPGLRQAIASERDIIVQDMMRRFTGYGGILPMGVRFNDILELAKEDPRYKATDLREAEVNRLEQALIAKQEALSGALEQFDQKRKQYDQSPQAKAVQNLELLLDKAYEDVEECGLNQNDIMANDVDDLLRIINTYNATVDRTKGWPALQNDLEKRRQTVLRAKARASARARYNALVTANPTIPTGYEELIDPEGAYAAAQLSSEQFLTLNSNEIFNILNSIHTRTPFPGGIPTTAQIELMKDFVTDSVKIQKNAYDRILHTTRETIERNDTVILDRQAQLTFVKSITDHPGTARARGNNLFNDPNRLGYFLGYREALERAINDNESKDGIPYSNEELTYRVNAPTLANPNNVVLGMPIRVRELIDMLTGYQNVENLEETEALKQQNQQTRLTRGSAFSVAMSSFESVVGGQQELARMFMRHFCPDIPVQIRTSYLDVENGIAQLANENAYNRAVVSRYINNFIKELAFRASQNL